MAGQTIGILGGGVGGLVAANELRRKLPQEHRITVVEKNALHAFAPSFLWLMTGDRKPEQIVRPLATLVRPGVEIVNSEVQQLDLANGRIETDRESLPYDYLIIALGAELAPENIPGLKEAAHTFYSFDGTIKLRDALQTFTGGMVAVVVCTMPYKCPGAPYEGAMLIADYFRKRGLRDEAVIHLLTPEPQPLPVAGPELGEGVRQMLEEKGICYHPQYQLKKVQPQTKTLEFEGKEPFQYDLAIAIPPHRAPAVVRESALANEAGWIPVDPATLAAKFENVYAIGDVTAISIPGRWKPDVPLSLPKAGVFAHGQALIVARCIAGKITGTPYGEVFCGDGFCMLEAGEDMAGFAYGDFFAEPAPQVKLHRLGRVWHLGKVLFENWWLAPYGFRREALRWALIAGAKAVGMPASF